MIARASTCGTDRSVAFTSLAQLRRRWPAGRPGASELAIHPDVDHHRPAPSIRPPPAEPTADTRTNGDRKI